MKKLIFLSFLACSALVNHTFSQVNNLYVGDSSWNCSSVQQLLIYFEVGSIDEVNPVISINWGDGTSDVINDQTYVANSSAYFTVDHAYASYGLYTVNANILSSVSGQTIYADPATLISSDVSNCGLIYSNCYQTNDCGQQLSNYIYDAVYDLTGADNTVTTFTGYMASGVNVNNVPYTLSLNDQWLANNNLVQSTADITITGFDSYGNPISTGNMTLEVQTANVSTIPDYTFFWAYGYGLLPPQTADCYFTIVNSTCTPNSTLQVNLTFPAFLTPDLSGLDNPAVSGNVLSFEINSQYTYYTGHIHFLLPGTTPLETPLDFTITLTDLSGTETFTGNNTVNFTGLIYNSWDPNDKLVNKAYNLDPNQTEELQYIINFQNEGNASALKVQVVDTLSPNVDLSTFRLLSSKHSVTTNLDPATRIVKFTFDNINLLPSSQDLEGSKGQLVYSVKENAGLPVNSEIKNTAYIYFDFNPAIITNTTINANTVLKVKELEKSPFRLSPNPASETFVVKGSNIESVSLIDASGKVVSTLPAYDGEAVSVADLENGIYFVRIQSKERIVTEKISVRK